MSRWPSQRDIWRCAPGHPIHRESRRPRTGSGSHVRGLPGDAGRWATHRLRLESIGRNGRNGRLGGWRPRLTARVDLTSGGDGGAGTRLTRFNPLYASTGNVGEGQFLSLSNVALIAPGVTMVPHPGATLAMEYGIARRMDERDAAYVAGAMRVYAGTRAVAGRGVGRLLRVPACAPSGRTSPSSSTSNTSPRAMCSAAPAYPRASTATSGLHSATSGKPH